MPRLYPWEKSPILRRTKRSVRRSSKTVECCTFFPCNSRPVVIVLFVSGSDFIPLPWCHKLDTQLSHLHQDGAWILSSSVSLRLNQEWETIHGIPGRCREDSLVAYEKLNFQPVSCSLFFHKSLLGSARPTNTVFFSFFLGGEGKGITKWTPHVSLKGRRISRLPRQPCWLYAKFALQQHSPLSCRLDPSENW